MGGGGSDGPKKRWHLTSSIPVRSHIWVQFVAGFLLALRVFLQVLKLNFVPPQESASLNFNSTRI